MSKFATADAHLNCSPASPRRTDTGSARLKGRLGSTLSGDGTKWRQLANLLTEIFTSAAVADGVAEEGTHYDAGTIEPPKFSPSQKLVIFTEHRDTLNYLRQRMSTLLGRPEAIVCIHGGMDREECMTAQESFRHDPEVKVLLATDAAGSIDAPLKRRVICSQKPDGWQLRRLLSPRRERPRRRRSAEQRDEVAPLHSITSSASSTNESGIVSPIALPVLRLTINS